MYFQLEPFQEWPQLLDTHLAGLVDHLATAFVDYLSVHATKYNANRGVQIEDTAVVPLPRGVCQILYVLCKIRGQKIVRDLLKTEPQLIDPLTDALEQWQLPIYSNDYFTTRTSGRLVYSDDDFSTADQNPMLWEEKYIMMLWLSHLMLTPFDLVSVTSMPKGILVESELSVDVPGGTPWITRRLISIAHSHLYAAGRQRDAAAMLLVRLTLRPDMVRIGLHRNLVSSTISSLELIKDGIGSCSIHDVIGRLSFLEKFVSSAEDVTLGPLLMPIFTVVRNVDSLSYSFGVMVKSSAFARKLVIKIDRSLITTSLRLQALGTHQSFHFDSEDFEGDILDNVFCGLQDADTSVRITASKAMSIVAKELHSEKTNYVVEQAVETLSVPTDKIGSFPLMSALQVHGLIPFHEQDFDQANVIHWHGLVLTLAQFVYHGSLPIDYLKPAMNSFRCALRFEQRSSLGASVGTNVRDAACFGLWSVARSYTTDQLRYTGRHGMELHEELQDMATDLLVAATLDPSGNIRRGASAALQELIGRHPGKIACGIELVQKIDYHAIALRSRAMKAVATKACLFGEGYRLQVLLGLMGWRGLCSPDVQSRRDAAKTIGAIAGMSSSADAGYIRTHLGLRLRDTPPQEVEQRQGLLFAYAEVISTITTIEVDMTDVATSNTDMKRDHEPKLSTRRLGLRRTVLYKGDKIHAIGCFPNFKQLIMGDRPTVAIGKALKYDLICEAVCCLISALVGSDSTRAPYAEDSDDESLISWTHETPSWMKECLDALNLCLRSTNLAVVQALSDASETLFQIIGQKELRERAHVWVNSLYSPKPSPKIGLVVILGKVYLNLNMSSERSENLHYVNPSKENQNPSATSLRSLIFDTMCQILNRAKDIELKCYTLKSLADGVLRHVGETFLASQTITLIALEDTINTKYMIERCLDDYTINERGDIGSLVRIEAINTVSKILKQRILSVDDQAFLAAKICGLAVEKLDIVRLRALSCLQQNQQNYKAHELLEMDVESPSHQLFSVIRHCELDSDAAQHASTSHFRQLLFLGLKTGIMPPLLLSYVTSAGAGSEKVSQASRSAFTSMMIQSSHTQLRDIFQILLYIMEQNFHNERLISPTLSFLAHILRSGYIELLEYGAAQGNLG